MLQTVQSIKAHYKEAIYIVSGTYPIIKGCSRGVVIEDDQLIYRPGIKDPQIIAPHLGLEAKTGDRIIYATPELLYQAYNIKKACMECAGISIE